MSFIKIADASELPVGKMKKVVVTDKEILLVNFEGTYYAISDKCPHMGASLSEGTLDGNIITCARHGSKYDVRTGKALGQAKILFLKFAVKDDRSYPIKQEGNDIMIDLD